MQLNVIKSKILLEGNSAQDVIHIQTSNWAWLSASKCIQPN